MNYFSKTTWLLPLLLTGLSSSAQYYYDDAGNLTKDLNKGIDSIYYNQLNLIEKVVFSEGKGEILYGYDATGKKLSKTVRSATDTTTRYYVNGLEYNDHEWEFLATEEGRITQHDRLFTYEYTIKDHLGNVRVCLDDRGLLQTDNYYPFGGLYANSRYVSGKENNYRYNSKEWQGEQLGFYDYGARMLDPLSARWHAIDPKAEVDYAISPYAYVRNNPLKYIDPKGETPTLVTAGIGLIVGFGVGAAIEAWDQRNNEEGIDWSKVTREGAKTSLVGGAIGLLGPGAGWIATAGTGAAANVGVNGAEALLMGEEYTLEKTQQDMVAGAFTAVGGKAAGIVLQGTMAKILTKRGQVLMEKSVQLEQEILKLRKEGFEKMKEEALKKGRSLTPEEMEKAIKQFNDEILDHPKAKELQKVHEELGKLIDKWEKKD